MSALELACLCVSVRVCVCVFAPARGGLRASSSPRRLSKSALCVCPRSCVRIRSCSEWMQKHMLRDQVCEESKLKDSEVDG